LGIARNCESRSQRGTVFTRGDVAVAIDECVFLNSNDYAFYIEGGSASISVTNCYVDGVWGRDIEQSNDRRELPNVEFGVIVERVDFECPMSRAASGMPRPYEERRMLKWAGLFTLVLVIFGDRRTVEVEFEVD
jgi:hypothetical protein